MVMEQDNTSRSQEYWDNFYLNLCKQYAKGSKDPSSQVAACLVHNKTDVVAIAYNGFEPGAKDSSDLYNDRDYKYDNIIHAEINVISKLYNGLRKYEIMSDLTLYVYPYPPCNNCAEEIIEVPEITRVVAPKDYPERWKDSMDLGMVKLRHANKELQLTEEPWAL